MSQQAKSPPAKLGKKPAPVKEADNDGSEDTDGPSQQAVGNRKQSTALQAPPSQDNQLQQANEALKKQLQILQEQAGTPAADNGKRITPVRQSRITDRPAKTGEKDSSLKIKIELDLEVEVDLYARVKGDVTIGLM